MSKIGIITLGLLVTGMFGYFSSNAVAQDRFNSSSPSQVSGVPVNVEINLDGQCTSFGIDTDLDGESDITFWPVPPLRESLTDKLYESAKNKSTVTIKYTDTGTIVSISFLVSVLPDDVPHEVSKFQK
ncbi:MAG: hypothetical protein HJJLKODD_00401 [Phycisphaerae bacterium]|nr:hypothetical protein [Phycisphaerae bacterium]